MSTFLTEALLNPARQPVAMKVYIINHARARMKQYNISEEVVVECLENPDDIFVGVTERYIAQKSLNSHVLRVIFEKENDRFTVVTTYKAKAKRYEI